MKNIFIIGAGLSATSLIDYLLRYAPDYDWKITVGDLSLDLAASKISNNRHGRAIKFDINDPQARLTEISRADIVVSMLPGSLHTLVAEECLSLEKHLLTPSYITSEMQEMDRAVRDKGLVFLNEMGVDPGIDHMSAMRVIDAIKQRGGQLLAFKSFCGGLVAPDCDDNPWNYKFSWNPRNVVIAGQGVAKYIENDQYQYVPYQQLFSTLHKIEMPDYGGFEVYPNRDSLQYRELYGLADIPTLIRGTMRRPGFCDAWNVFVQLGCTDDTFIMEDSHLISYRQYLESFLPASSDKGTEVKLVEFADLAQKTEILEKLRWLGIFSDEIVGLKDATPAMILEKILERKWSMGASDRDLLVMQHQFDFLLEGKKKRIISSMSYEAKDNAVTAMAYTVGTPLAVAVKLIALGHILPIGVRIPISADIYNPILDELSELDVKFAEKEIEL